MVSGKKIFDATINALFSFSTVRVVKVKNVKAGLIFRSIQVALFLYIIIWSIVLKKGYQAHEKAQYSITTKVNGIASTMDANHPKFSEKYRRIWDTANYVVPHHENAFFVTTNAVITAGQQFAECAEDGTKRECIQETGSKPGCVNGTETEFGIKTGRRCDDHTVSKKPSCQIQAWCPIEDDSHVKNKDAKPLFPEAANFTVFIQNYVDFPKFKRSRSNVPDDFDPRFCRYPKCPIFRLGDIVQRANSSFDDIATVGGVIKIAIEWKCNLDYRDEFCNPDYTFTRIDDDGSRFIKGWNFRHAYYYRTNGTPTRDLIEAYGILFVISVNGEGAMFDFVELMTKVGAGLGLLTVAPVLCDMIVPYLVKYKEDFLKLKCVEVVCDIIPNEKTDSSIRNALKNETGGVDLNADADANAKFRKMWRKKKDEQNGSPGGSGSG